MFSFRLYLYSKTGFHKKMFFWLSSMVHSCMVHGCMVYGGLLYGVWLVWKTIVNCMVVWCIVVWCTVVWCLVVWCIVVWCTVVWCLVVWCIVVWCMVLWFNFIIYWYSKRNEEPEKFNFLFKKLSYLYYNMGKSICVIYNMIWRLFSSCHKRQH